MQSLTERLHEPDVHGVDVHYGANPEADLGPSALVALVPLLIAALFVAPVAALYKSIAGSIRHRHR